MWRYSLQFNIDNKSNILYQTLVLLQKISLDSMNLLGADVDVDVDDYF